MRNIVICISAAVLGAVAAPARQWAEPPAFEVASVKTASQDADRNAVRMAGGEGRIDYGNVSLIDVLKTAYKVRSCQIDAPEWMERERYDIVAKIPAGVSREQVPAMLQRLLAERFRMALRKETRRGSTYALLVAKDGPKLKQAAEKRQAAPLAPGAVTTTTTVGPDGSATLQLKSASMAALTELLSNILNQPVADLTALDGSYDIGIDAGVDEIMGIRRRIPGAAPIGHEPTGAAPPSRATPDSPPSAPLLAAIRRLGLKLEPRKGPVEYIVIEKAERAPTEN